MVLKLYYNINTAPSRPVIYTLNALNLPYELIRVSLQDNEQLTEKFCKINPQHTLPTLDDDGFILWDSHAINAYLVTKYGKDDKLYPKDPKARAVVDQMLHFDNGVLLSALLANIKKIIVNEASTIVTDELKQLVEEAREFLELFLADGRRNVAGNYITIADFSILATLTNLSVFIPLNTKKYPLIADYIKRHERVIPYFTEFEEQAKREVTEILENLHFEFNCK